MDIDHGFIICQLTSNFATKGSPNSTNRIGKHECTPLIGFANFNVDGYKIQEFPRL